LIPPEQLAPIPPPPPGSAQDPSVATSDLTAAELFPGVIPHEDEQASILKQIDAIQGDLEQAKEKQREASEAKKAATAAKKESRKRANETASNVIATHLIADSDAIAIPT
jgi:hypothetical protein